MAEGWGSLRSARAAIQALRRDFSLAEITSLGACMLIAPRIVRHIQASRRISRAIQTLAGDIEAFSVKRQMVIDATERDRQNLEGGMTLNCSTPALRWTLPALPCARWTATLLGDCNDAQVAYRLNDVLEFLVPSCVSPPLNWNAEHVAALLVVVVADLKGLSPRATPAKVIQGVRTRSSNTSGPGATQMTRLAVICKIDRPITPATARAALPEALRKAQKRPRAGGELAAELARDIESDSFDTIRELLFERAVDRWSDRLESARDQYATFLGKPNTYSKRRGRRLQQPLPPVDVATDPRLAKELGEFSEMLRSFATVRSTPKTMPPGRKGPSVAATPPSPEALGAATRALRPAKVTGKKLRLRSGEPK